jgi:hypothetical protein
MITGHDYRAMATHWAASTLSLLCCELVAFDGGWDVETSSGWKTAENWKELVAIARSELKKYHQSRQAA